MQFDPNNPNLVPWREVEHLVQDGWLAQFRGREWLSRLIMAVSNGVHSHSAMLRRVNGNGHQIDILDIDEARDGAALPFEQVLKTYSGQIDLFAPDQDRWMYFSARGAVNHMRILTGRKYGRRGILRLYAMKFPIVRLFFGASTDDLLDASAQPFCSHAVTTAYRVGGGVDPVPNRPDHLVSPADLTSSLFFSYRFTPTASL